MIVRLTNGQVPLVESAFAGDFDDLAHFRSDVRQATMKQVEIDAPYPTWDFVLRALVSSTVSPAGRKVVGAPVRSVNAIKAVRSAMGAYERHPALRGLGMVGWHFGIIYGWAQERDAFGRLVSPMPNGGEFVELMPEHQGYDRFKVTVWSRSAQERVEERLAAERSHLRFQRRQFGDGE